MKNNISIILILILILSIIPSTSFAATTPSIIINNTPVQFTPQTGTPFIDGNDRTLVPMRVVMEQFGCEVLWVQSSRNAVVSKGDVTVRIPIGQSFIVVNDVKQTNDAPAQIIEGRTYLPIRSVLEAVGGKVEWDNVNKCVAIYSDKNTQSASESGIDSPQYITNAKSSNFKFVRIDGKLYQYVYSYELKHELEMYKKELKYNSNDLNDIYFLNKDFYGFDIKNLFALLTNSFITTSPENPYVDSAIDVYSTAYDAKTINVTEKANYASATEKKLSYVHSYNGKTIEFPSKVIGNTQIEQIRISDNYINLKDYCNYFGIDVDVKILYDDDLKQNIIEVNYN